VSDFTSQPTPCVSLTTCSPGVPDAAFIVFGSPEKRCLGAAQRFNGYAAKRFCILCVNDEPNQSREDNVSELQRLFSGPTNIVSTSHGDPLRGLDLLMELVRSSITGGNASDITLDASTFPKDSLLLILRALDRHGYGELVRIVYTEPQDYSPAPREPLTYGLRDVHVVPTFAAPYRPDRELVLIVFLGYEGDRALGVVEAVEPHRVVAIIGAPPYQKEWAGRAEEFNHALLLSLARSDIRKADPRNPLMACQLLEQIYKELPRGANIYIVPLGTKPQTVGAYYFIKRHPSFASIVYAAPLARNQQYIARDIGATWILPPFREQGK